MRTTSRVTGETAATHALAEMRWAGASLAVGAVLYMIAIILFATLYGHPEGTGPGGNVTLVDIAEHTRARWKLSQGLWSMEMAGALLIGLAALILQRGRRTGPSWLPTSVAWSAVAVGASTLTVMYAFTLGSYPPALAAIHEQTALFAALRGGVRSLFHVGMAAMFFGFTGAFIGETLAKDACTSEVGCIRRRSCDFVGNGPVDCDVLRLHRTAFAASRSGRVLSDRPSWSLNLETSPSDQLSEMKCRPPLLPSAVGRVV